MRSLSFGGDKPAHVTVNIHLDENSGVRADTITVGDDAIPVLTIGAVTNDANLFFMDRRVLDRVIQALAALSDHAYGGKWDAWAKSETTPQ
jgi:hypothetical protein